MPTTLKINGKYVTNDTGAVLTHGKPVQIGKFVGVAVKQKAPAWSDAYSAQQTIALNEPFFLITKGVVTCAEVSGFAVGDAVYIDNASVVSGGHVLTESGTGSAPFGRVVEIEGERGTATNTVRIDLDIKSAVDAAAF